MDLKKEINFFSKKWKMIQKNYLKMVYYTFQKENLNRIF